MVNILSILLPTVLKAGEKAKSSQKGVSHSYKKDGSILTHIDTELNSLLCQTIREHFPDANIISEEEDSVFKPDRKYTFTVDPIDGTDSYSQGLPGWCIAIGLLNSQLTPVGGIIYAPRWSTPTSDETLVVIEPGQHPTINGESIFLDMSSELLPEQSQVMISSSLHKSVNIQHYPGKTKYAGCAVLNILAITMYQRVTCTLITPLHIWDIAAAHAVLNALGLILVYSNGDSISYKALTNRELTRELILAGSIDSVSTTKKFINQVSE